MLFKKKKPIIPDACARNRKLQTENTDIKKKKILKISTEEKWQKCILCFLVSCMTLLLTTSALEKRVVSKSTISLNF